MTPMPRDLNWPEDYPRTPPHERERTSKFEVTLNQAVRDIQDEMRRLGADGWRFESDMDHKKKKPNYPYANAAEPEDPGVVVRWTMDGEQFAVPCDHYTRVRDNARTLGLYIREKRKMEGREVATLKSEFSNLQLPSGDEDRTVPPHEVLGLDEDEDRPHLIKRQAQHLIQESHPDSADDGEADPAAVKRIKDARDAMLADL